MSRGGKRTANPGSMLPNRSDLRTTQPIQANGNGQYGSAKASEDAQRAMPLQNAAGLQAQAAPSVLPGQLGAFDRPTERPNEPVTAGAALGAGPGPEALVPGTVDTTTATRLRAIYQRYPNEGLRMLLEQMDNPN